MFCWLDQLLRLMLIVSLLWLLCIVKSAMAVAPIEVAKPVFARAITQSAIKKNKTNAAQNIKQAKKNQTKVANRITDQATDKIIEGTVNKEGKKAVAKAANKDANETTNQVAKQAANQAAKLSMPSAKNGKKNNRVTGQLPNTLSFTPGATHARPVAGPKIVVMLDAGHGGKDGGARGMHGALEKDISLKMAKRIKFYLDRYRKFRVILTRDGDRYYTLQQRVNLARRHRAKLFISLHADALPAHARRRSEVRGVTIFALSPSGAVSVASRWLTRAEKSLANAHEVAVGDLAVQGWLTDLASHHISKESEAAGNAILQSLNQVSRLNRSRIAYADFWVLKAPHVPSLLIEVGFISHPQEAKLLMQASYRDRLAQAIASGIAQHFAH